ncbi:alpha-amylase family glycosyl hydrolase [Aerosakkonemataceae cyanobacterium BLCC-F154]|uniref:Alpha-amylase family glycosyl hydrolase n=1 Tax=Floridaenema fluviatile BLCC-F154 TaxID=3153640 RepID=A0ABV4YHF1_9CYAN
MVSSIEFSLFAPYNKDATLMGSFNNWQETSMTKGEDGYFRTFVELEDGIYQYKFRVQSNNSSLSEEWVEIVDPYATEIDPQTCGAVARVKEGKRILDTYVWQHDDKPLPDNHELIIYELHVADFSGSDADSEKREVLKRVIDKLDYLKDLGINAIELMPLNEHPANYNWGYLVSDFFALECSYGFPEDLKRLVDESHARGIRVILDGIYNHSAEECPLLKIDRNYWYYSTKKEHKKETDYWGPEFNYEFYDEKLDIRPTWKFIGDVVRFWIQEYHIDGIRFDAVSQLASLDIKKPNFDFINWITQEAKKAAGNKPFYNIGECIPEKPTIVTPNGPMDGAWHESFRMFITENICNDVFDSDKLQEVLDPKKQNYATTNKLVNYLANHDRERLLGKLVNVGILDANAFKRAKLAAVLLMTAVGVPMIWMGEEFGESQRKTKSTDQPSPIRWNLLENQLNHDLFEYYKKLITLRTQNPALYSENISLFHTDPENKVLAYSRWNEEGARVVVVANFSDRDLAQYKVNQFPEHSNWYDWLEGNHVEAKDNQLIVDLGEHEAKVFVSK